ncbi:1,2-phenylacetyl-CoA epoxidase subunit PaaC [Undibacterium sp. TS12]|uniref:1,2-phenylacetyl-CoA epoxidase subunit PaaC n=1 Tax=Undibacterium sp. TS12 TaxID=2908202 RepID=UPI001F4CA2C1|nr:1,2-phenylacetyl-CoA epoxidase subunit PaaC [Undibacterium sp. TS12]MCH8619103.1 phenylacetate-CoA oxygenase subunit PaaC [Undibacterium sp. TS12]
MSDDKFNYVLRLADNALILSQRLSQWCGKGPALEEDMALTNVALDLIGQARLWYAYAAELEGKGRTEDDLAFLRDAHQFHNFLLLEQPNGNYADTMTRQFLFDAWHYHYLQALCASGDERIAAIAAKSLKEVTYHLRRSSDLLVRLGDGSDLSHQLMQAALDELWRFTGEMSVADELDLAMHGAGIAPDLAMIRQAWVAHVASVAADATLRLPDANSWMHKGGKQGVHTEHMGYLLAEMQFLQRAYPGAQW